MHIAFFSPIIPISLPLLSACVVATNQDEPSNHFIYKLGLANCKGMSYTEYNTIDYYISTS